MVCLLTALGWAVGAQAKKYYVTGGGAQLAIGGHFPLPIQTFMITPGGMQTWTGTNFPPLLIAPVCGASVDQTTVMSQQQRITIPSNVLSRPQGQNTVGFFHQNNLFYAVGTNIGYQWPALAAVFSTAARPGATTTSATTPSGNRITYSKPVGWPATKFGGPATFRINKVYGQGVFPNAAMTMYAVVAPGSGNPPCTHPVFGGTNSACIIAFGAAVPNTIPVTGGPFSNVGTTPGGTPNAVARGGPYPGAAYAKIGSAGTPLSVLLVPVTGFTNMGSSYGYPFTTGMLTISAGGAGGVFKITGMDNRTTGGAGTVQLVSGALVQRAHSGPGASRGWVQLKLIPIPPTPTMSPAGLAATAGLILLAAAYAMRRRLSR